jgi:hypothetical protein
MERSSTAWVMAVRERYFSFCLPISVAIEPEELLRPPVLATRALRRLFSLSQSPAEDWGIVRCDEMAMF